MDKSMEDSRRPATGTLGQGIQRCNMGIWDAWKGNQRPHCTDKETIRQWAIHGDDGGESYASSVKTETRAGWV